MSFRITTNMIKNTYQYNLMNSTNKLADARDKVQTQRNFSSYAEDPAAATQAFRLRRDFCQTTSQISNTKDVYSKFNTAWQNIQGMLKDLINPMEKMSVIRGEQDTTAEARQSLAQVLRATSESMIEGFNQELGGHFIFAGNDGLNAPFTWKGDTLYYRGIDVNSGGVEKPNGPEPTWAFDANGDPAVDKYGVPTGMPLTGANDEENAWIAYYTDQGNYAKLKEMSEEEMYIDLGMGAEELGANNPLRGTYFNSALSGLNFTDFGVDEDGDPKNFAILMRELADVFDTWDEDVQKYNPALAKGSAAGLTSEELQEKAFRLMDKLKAAQETLTAANVELDARSTFLRTNQSQLELQSTNLNMDILDVEQVDLAAAITDFSWDMYCYNAALKIGNQLLSQSLIDYMS